MDMVGDRKGGEAVRGEVVDHGNEQCICMAY